MSNLLVRRVTGFVAAGVFFLVAVVLLLADRSGSVVADVHEVIVAAGRRVERASNVDVVDRRDLPGTRDQYGHMALWGTGMLLVGWLLRRRVPLAVTALFMAAISLGFELSQPLVSTFRTFELSDTVGNLTGVASATVLLAASRLLWHRYPLAAGSRLDD